MQNYHYTYIIILILLGLITFYYIIEKVGIIEPVMDSECKSCSSIDTTLSTKKIVTNPENPTPNNKSYSMTPFQIVQNTNDIKTVKPIVIAKNSPTYIEPKKFVLEQDYDRFYNFVLNEFSSAELYSITHSHIILDPSDLIQRNSSSSLKSILLPEDIKEISQIVYYLIQQNNNNVGAYMTITSLEKDREDVEKLFLHKDIDYSTYYKRTLMSGEEYLPIGEPTPNYEAFIQYRLSQIKRCGFSFVQLGVIDPLSMFDYTKPDVKLNPTVKIEQFRNFIIRILKYCKELELKVCISEFPALFTNYEKELTKYIHYVHIFNNDARSFKKPSDNFIKEFSTKPVFLSTVLCNNVIDNFIINTCWPENSILYEMSMFGNPLPTPDLPIKIIPRIKWCPYPKRWWINSPVKLPPTNMLVPSLTNEMLFPIIPVHNN